MLSVRDLRKRYGDLVALDGVSFEVQKGDVLGFLGQNGAGKSTTMKIVTGFIPPSSGTAIVDGFDVVKSSIEARRRIGYLPEATPLYTEMRVAEYLEYRARLKGVARRDVKKRVDYAVTKLKLQDRVRQLIGTLSKGYRQRVGIADAIVADPRLLILDEPTIGLDPNQIREVRQLIKELGEHHTIIFSTHILVEVEMVCSRVVIIDRGRSVAQGTVRGLVEQHQGNTLALSLRAKDATLDEVTRALTSVPGIKNAKEQLGETASEVIRFSLEADVDGDREAALRSAAERVAARVAEKGWAIRELVPEKTTLENVFVQLTMRENDGARALEAASAPTPELVGAAAPAAPVAPPAPSAAPDAPPPPSTDTSTSTSTSTSEGGTP
ncbi:MAG: ABC transporter ATP-binding protein [Planctomycetota bacterium]